MLTNKQEKLWLVYIGAEEDRIRSVSLAALDAFLAALAESNISDWSDWAFAVAQKRVDGKDPFPVRMPLFSRAIFPALLDGLQHRRPGCARWMAGFMDLIQHRKECLEALTNNLCSKPALLRLALEHDPDDVVARCELIAWMHCYLDYTLHELPSGVLYDQNGADAAKCRELCELLSEFEQLVNMKGTSQEESELIEDCRFHYEQYPRYLADHKQYGSYAAYLEALKVRQYASTRSRVDS